MTQRPKPTVRVVEEAEAPRAWRFTIEVDEGEGENARTVALTLGWADYDHWSRGRLSPAEVVQGLVACALTTIDAAALPPCLDASTLRRLAPGLDERVGEFFDR